MYLDCFWLLMPVKNTRNSFLWAHFPPGLLRGKLQDEIYNRKSAKAVYTSSKAYRHVLLRPRPSSCLACFVIWPAIMIMLPITVRSFLRLTYASWLSHSCRYFPARSSAGCYRPGSPVPAPAHWSQTCRMAAAPNPCRS